MFQPLTLSFSLLFSTPRHIPRLHDLCGRLPSCSLTCWSCSSTAWRRKTREWWNLAWLDCVTPVQVTAFITSPLKDLLISIFVSDIADMLCLVFISAPQTQMCQADMDQSRHLNAQRDCPRLDSAHFAVHLHVFADPENAAEMIRLEGVQDVSACLSSESQHVVS